MRRIHLRGIFRLSLMLLDVCALMAAFQSAYTTRFFSSTFLHFFPAVKGVPDFAIYRNSLFAMMPLWILMFYYAGLYRDTLVSAYDEFVQVLKGVLLCAMLTTALSFAFRTVEFSRLVVGLWSLYGAALVYALREADKWLFRRLTLWTAGPQQVLVIGRGKALDAIRQIVASQSFYHCHFLHDADHRAAVEERLRRNHISEVVLIQAALTPSAILEVATLCEQLDIPCRIVPDLLEMRRGEIIFDGFAGLPTFSIKSLSLFGFNFFAKRSFDLVVSLAVLTVTALPLLFIALLIRLESPGPILFCQDRVGFRGRKFKVFKFRTMVRHADAMIDEIKHLSDRSGPVFKMKDDPRVTRIGRWLRRFSLDEVPQILNVLMGDMSIVGPRPQVLWEAAHYDDMAKKRLRVMPGITGLWQVSGRAALSYEEMINLDIYYLENWSLGLDLKILLRTLPAVFAREGAY